MRLNRYVANATGLSRRAADDLIAAGKILVNSRVALLGQKLEGNETISLNGKTLVEQAFQYLLLNKPVGYVCSRAQQDSAPTIYSLLPKKYYHLKPVGRLDKDSCGLLLLTNDGTYAQELTHPKNQKEKTYRVFLESSLKLEDKKSIEQGIMLKDGQSKFKITEDGNSYIVSLSEGKNRQIRRTFGKLGYSVTNLQRLTFADYQLGDLPEGKFQEIKRT